MSVAPRPESEATHCSAFSVSINSSTVAAISCVPVERKEQLEAEQWWGWA